MLATTLLWAGDGTRWLQGPFSQRFHDFVVDSPDAFRRQQTLKYDSSMRKLDHASQKQPCRSPGMGITVMVIWAAGRIRHSWQFASVSLLGYGLHTEPNAAHLIDVWFTWGVQTSAFPARLGNAPFQISESHHAEEREDLLGIRWKPYAQN